MNNDELKHFIDWFTTMGEPAYDGDRRQRFKATRLLDTDVPFWIYKGGKVRYSTDEVLAIYNQEQLNPAPEPTKEVDVIFVCGSEAERTTLVVDGPFTKTPFSSKIDTTKKVDFLNKD
jgi:hypothetical protein